MELSDLVRATKLETTVLGTGSVQHVLYTPDPLGGRNKLTEVERWVRDKFLGQGSYGCVHRERCEDKNKTRAVKEIRKSVVVGETLEYIRELEAIFTFSQPQVSSGFFPFYPCIGERLHALSRD